MEQVEQVKPPPAATALGWLNFRSAAIGLLVGIAGSFVVYTFTVGRIYEGMQKDLEVLRQRDVALQESDSQLQIEVRTVREQYLQQQAVLAAWYDAQHCEQTGGTYNWGVRTCIPSGTALNDASR